jgi:hypothetical protein
MTNKKQSNAKSNDPLPNLKPWEQQPTETDLLYSYFNIYREQPTQIRSLSKVQQHLQQQDRNITYDHIKNISSQNKWQSRVSAYDKHMSQLSITSKEMNVQKMNDKHFNLGKTCIDSLLSDIEDPELLSVPVDKRAYVKQALIRGMEGAVRIQRLALGESTSNTKQVNEGINNLMMVLTDSKKQLQKKPVNTNNVVDIEYSKPDD